VERAVLCGEVLGKASRHSARDRRENKIVKSGRKITVFFQEKISEKNGYRQKYFVFWGLNVLNGRGILPGS